MTGMPVRLPDGRIQIPVSTPPNPIMIGDGVKILSPGDDGYDKADAWLKSRGL